MWKCQSNIFCETEENVFQNIFAISETKKNLTWSFMILYFRNHLFKKKRERKLTWFLEKK